MLGPFRLTFLLHVTSLLLAVLARALVGSVYYQG
jgi:hypothetical protein